MSRAATDVRSPARRDTSAARRCACPVKIRPPAVGLVGPRRFSVLPVLSASPRAVRLRPRFSPAVYGYFEGPFVTATQASISFFEVTGLGKVAGRPISGAGLLTYSAGAIPRSARSPKRPQRRRAPERLSASTPRGAAAHLRSSPAVPLSPSELPPFPPIFPPRKKQAGSPPPARTGPSAPATRATPTSPACGTPPAGSSTPPPSSSASCRPPASAAPRAPSSR